MKDENRNPKKVYAVLHIALLSALKKIDMSLDERFVILKKLFPRLLILARSLSILTLFVTVNL